jgi:hypothetical protein
MDACEGICPDKPDKDKPHDEPKISIVSIEDAAGEPGQPGNSIIGGAQWDTRSCAVKWDSRRKPIKKTCIKFKVEQQASYVYIWVMIDPKNTLAWNYYKREIWIHRGDFAVGVHTVKWDGRVNVPKDGSRLIIQGDYSIMIGALCSKCLKPVPYDANNEARIRVKKPIAYFQSSIYPHLHYSAETRKETNESDPGRIDWKGWVSEGSGPNEELKGNYVFGKAEIRKLGGRFVVYNTSNTLEDVLVNGTATAFRLLENMDRIRVGGSYLFFQMEEHHVYGEPFDLDNRPQKSRTYLEQLNDGSGFETAGTPNDSAFVGMMHLRDSSAVWSYDGHANAGILDFYDNLPEKTDVDGHPYRNTCIFSSEGVKTSWSLPGKTVEGLDAWSLEDVSLIVLNACLAANEPAKGEKSLPQLLCERGADIVVAFRTSVHIDAGTLWSYGFWSRLQQGLGVQEAAAEARDNDVPEIGQKSLNFKIFTNGASKKTKLTPARYGRKKM